MGGGGVYQINKLVWGVDLVEEQLLAVCSIPSKPYLPDSPLHFLAEYSINAKVSGVLQNDDFLEVRKFNPGETCGRLLVFFVGRPYILFQGPSCNAFEWTAEQAGAPTTKFPVETVGTLSLTCGFWWKL